MIEVSLRKKINKKHFKAIVEHSIKNGYKVLDWGDNYLELTKTVEISEIKALTHNAKKTGWKIKLYQVGFRNLSDKNLLRIFA